MTSAAAASSFPRITPTNTHFDDNTAEGEGSTIVSNSNTMSLGVISEGYEDADSRRGAGWEKDEESDSDSLDDLWDMDREMTAEEVSAALAEEKRRKKAKAKVAKEKEAFDLRLADLQGVSRLREKEAVAASKRARDPRRVIER